MLSWMYLIFAILFEVAGTTAMKFSEGFTKTVPSVLMAVFYILSLTALTFALKKFEVGTAYAIWSGIGTALIAVIGYYFFHESMSTFKILSILLIITGVIGLHLSTQA